VESSGKDQRIDSGGEGMEWGAIERERDVKKREVGLF
jgi:hypothetical protein